MALSSIDERDLLLPLFTGLDEEPLWDTFLHRLLARTRAQRLHLFIRPAGMTGVPPIRRTIRTAGYVRPAGFFDLETFSDAGLLPFAALRPNRVYSLEETTVPESAEMVRKQRAVLDEASVAHARFIRIVAPGDQNAWLVLLHDRLDFEAADSALLSAIAPHVAAALATLMELRGLRLRAAIAEDALALIGVGQAIFDAGGQVILADAIAQEELDVQATGRPQIRAGAAQALNGACRELSQASPQARRTVRFDDRAGRDMLLRRAPVAADSTLSSGYSVGLVRRARHGKSASAAPVVAATLGLSTREAALAEAISQGRSIVEAGAQLQLTQETARNYSKRIYAKTGASGQADLVRMILTGLAPFA
jgi:DNA-binding CsgD family transcriptional regulator